MRRIPGLSRIRRAMQPRQVEETATVARALTALYGRMPEVELLPGGASRVARAVLTAKVLQEVSPCPWPAGMSRQTDPGDPAFLPPLGMHPVLVARDRTLLGLPDRDRLAWVDPLGWCGIDAGPTVAVWFGDARRAWPVGLRPDERPADDRLSGDRPTARDSAIPAADAPARVQQTRGLNYVSVSTHCHRGELSLELTHFPVVLDGRVAFALHARVSVNGPAARPVRLAFAIRPAGFEGVAPIFNLARSADGLWTADGEPLLVLTDGGHEVMTAVHGEPDPWLRMTGQARHGSPKRPGAVERRCPVGLCSAVELYRATVSPGDPFSRFAIFAPPQGIAPALVRTSGKSLWVGAQADRKGLLQSGCEVTLTHHQDVLEAARMRLLIEPAGADLGGMLGAIALARLGFTRRAGERIAAALSRVRRDGTLPDAEGPETAAVVAWAAAEFLRWTDARTVAQATRRSWTRLVEQLIQTEPEPGGFAWFGSGGSQRWTATWRAAALVGAAAVLRDSQVGVDDDTVKRWALAGAAACEKVEDRLGDGPWQSTRERVPDGSSAAMLAAAWLGVVPADHRGVEPTLRFLRDRAWHGGGVLLHGGAHVAATALWVAAQERLDPTVDRLGIVADLASGTGALPTVRHPSRGALEEGDDLLSSALFVLLAVERVQATRGVLRILPGIQEARGLPTPYGPVDLDSGVVRERSLRGQWRGAVPQVEWVED